MAVAADPATFDLDGGGNLIIVGSDLPIDVDVLQDSLDSRDVPWRVLTGPPLDEWVANARVLTDDRAPTDQLLTPYNVTS